MIVLLQYNFALFGILNTTFFLLSFIVLWLNRKNLKSAISVIKNDYEEDKITTFGYIIKFFKDCNSNLKILVNLNQIFHFTVIFAIMNLISAAQTSLLLITFIKTDSLQFGSFGFTVAIVETVETLGIILGAFLPLSFFRKKSIESNLILEIIIVVGIIINIIFMQDKYLLLILIFLSGYFIGLFNPRIDSFIMIVTPESSLSSVTSIFYTIIQITLPLSAVFLVIANTTSIQLSWIILLIVSLLLLIYSFILSFKNSTIPEKLS